MERVLERLSSQHPRWRSQVKKCAVSLLSRAKCTTALRLHLIFPCPRAAARLAPAPPSCVCGRPPSTSPWRCMMRSALSRCLTRRCTNCGAGVSLQRAGVFYLLRLAQQPGVWRLHRGPARAVRQPAGAKPLPAEFVGKQNVGNFGEVVGNFGCRARSRAKSFARNHSPVRGQIVLWHRHFSRGGLGWSTTNAKKQYIYQRQDEGQCGCKQEACQKLVCSTPKT